MVKRNKLDVEHVRINSQGYDSHGKYWGNWGTREKLYRVTDQLGLIDRYVRASNAKSARLHILALGLK